MNRPYNGIDTAAKITANAAKILREEGFSFVARYLVPNSGNTAWKALTASEVKDIRDARLAVMLCWEATASRVKGGAAAGAEDGRTVRKLGEGMGVPAGTVIYFAADYNVPASDYDAVDAYLDAAMMNCGLYIAGLYGHENVVNAMAKRGYKHFWQCVAWSNEFSDAAEAIQYQWQGSPDALAVKDKIGVAVDLDSAASLNGMWLPEPVNTEAEDAHKWCIDMGISDDTMRDVSQTELMFYRYHKLTAPEDYKTSSGLLTD